MPHYSFGSADDGTIRRILRDGQPYHHAVRLEQVYSVVTLYFQLARSNLDARPRRIPMTRDANTDCSRF